jgi:hypothetical protein
MRYCSLKFSTLVPTVKRHVYPILPSLIATRTKSQEKALRLERFSFLTERFEVGAGGKRCGRKEVKRKDLVEAKEAGEKIRVD